MVYKEEDFEKELETEGDTSIIIPSGPIPGAIDFKEPPSSIPLFVFDRVGVMLDCVVLSIDLPRHMAVVAVAAGDKLTGAVRRIYLGSVVTEQFGMLEVRAHDRIGLRYEGDGKTRDGNTFKRFDVWVVKQ